MGLLRLFFHSDDAKVIATRTASVRSAWFVFNAARGKRFLVAVAHPKEARTIAFDRPNFPHNLLLLRQRLYRSVHQYLYRSVHRCLLAIWLLLEITGRRRLFFHSNVAKVIATMTASARSAWFAFNAAWGKRFRVAAEHPKKARTIASGQ